MRNIILTTALTAAMALPMMSTAAAQSVSIDAEAKVGYSQPERVSRKVYEVTVDGDRRDSQKDVFEEALYKAAKKTIKNDYDWFRIVDRETERETVRTKNRSSMSGHYERVPERQCGLLGCTTTYRTHYRGDIGSEFPDREDTVYSVTLEFEMGSGAFKNGDGLYDARSVKSTYK